MQRVADALQLELSDFRRQSTAAAAPTGDLLILTFEANQRDRAAEGATAYGEALLAERQSTIDAVNTARASGLQQSADDLSEQLETISRQIAEEEARGDEASASRLTLLEATQDSTIERLAQVTTELAATQTNVEVGRVLIDPRTAVSPTGLGTPILVLSGALIGGMIGFIVALIKDRVDRRYGNTAGASLLGLREIARVPYSPATDVNDQTPSTSYGRLLTHLTFTTRRNGPSGRSVLLLPVDSETMPPDVARSVAAALERSARLNGIVVNVWTDDQAIHNQDRTTWERIAGSVRQLCATNDLVLVPEAALDRSSVGLGLSALVDDTVLLVTENTPFAAVQAAVDDIRTVKVDDAQVALVTDVPHSARSGSRNPGYIDAN
jgi:hypothetical protein